MNIKKLARVAIAAIPVVSFAAVPEVTAVTMSQAADRLVTITYTLSDAPAVITLEVQTNATGDVWASIGGVAVCNAEGDVWKKVETGSHTITWRPDLSWPDHKIAAGGARAVVTAWALDNTPDYMAVDISDYAQANTQRYYPAADFVPGGVLANTMYRKTKILMRKIMAKGVEWTMGSTKLETSRQTDEKTHQVTLTNNYYIGVFPVTQEQWYLVSGDFPSYFTNAADRAMRPVEKVSFYTIRKTRWPNAIGSTSFLKSLQTKTGIVFDLPSEAQWEFAARAGNGDTLWGDGSGIMNAAQDENLNLFGRYTYSGGKIDGTTNPDASCGATNGTAIVGSYRPNSWGLYDTAGNVTEWCLDKYAEDISDLNGAVNTDGTYHVYRGGRWNVDASNCRPARRGYGDWSDANNYNGFRLYCTAGLQ